MNGFELLKRDKGLLFKNNPFSVPCVLSNGTETQKDLKCIGDFVGIEIDRKTGSSIINDSSEAVINYDDVKIGKIESGWTLSFLQGGTNEIIDFMIDYVMQDKTAGVYKLKLSLLKSKNSQQNVEKNNFNIQRKNGGI